MRKSRTGDGHSSWCPSSFWLSGFWPVFCGMSTWPNAGEAVGLYRLDEAQSFVRLACHPADNLFLHRGVQNALLRENRLKVADWIGPERIASEVDAVDQGGAAALAGALDGFAGYAVDGAYVGGVYGDHRHAELQRFRNVAVARGLVRRRFMKANHNQ